MIESPQTMLTLASFSLAAVICIASIAYFYAYPKVVRLSALALPAQRAARQHLKTIRFQKMDKEPVVILSMQKGGSTLMCYVCALINTRNAIQKFRNDFDLIPMLSFPQPMINQNVNARQEGKYQLYKINGRASVFHENLRNEYDVKKTVWLCRDFAGYYCSVFWWVKSFYPRVRPLRISRARVFFFLRNVKWNYFKSKTLELLAKDHVDELWHVYCLLKRTPSSEFLALSYEHLCNDKVATLKKLSAWFGINSSSEMLQSISVKTSKEEMAEGDRFDPLHFGDGGGQTKVNTKPHKHALSEEEMDIYNDIFKQRFKDVGIETYAEYIEEIRRMQS